MLEIEEINNLLGVDESWKAPERIMKVLFSDEKSKVFSDFLDKEPNLSYDWFTDYYQEEHSDRKNNKQDFTPNKVTELMSKLLGSTTYNADVCAGTGGLTIKRWLDNKKAHFYCEEFSDRALPFLLFNLAIRKVNAEVFHGDSLTEEPKALYRLTSGEEFSDITTVEAFGIKSADTVIMNPPYSFKWNQVEEPRFTDYGPLAPKSKADYAFLLTGLNHLSDDGTMAIILPHGVLFRGSAEGKIRQRLIELNLLDAVIGLPGKLFLNTDIPTVILILKKNRTKKDIFFIDANKEFTKGKNHNYLEDKHLNKILKAYQSRKPIEKFASVVGLNELKENDFNLNIPRYVDTFEPEKVPELREIQADMQKIDKQIDETVSGLVQMMSELTAPDQAELDEFVGYLTQRYNVGGGGKA